MRKEQFVEGEYYHIYNRGVEKRLIFFNDLERTRFVNSIYLLNNFSDIPPQFDVINLSPPELLTPIEPYVEIVAGCLMPNHYHLMCTPKIKNGISKFLHKIGTSYARYFNIKHERTGRLFSSTFKAKHVDRHEYAVYLTQYIHLNPVELFQAKLGKEMALEAVKVYQWSSLPDYLGGKSKFSLIISPNFRDQVLDLNRDDYSSMVGEIYKESFQA